MCEVAKEELAGEFLFFSCAGSVTLNVAQYLVTLPALLLVPPIGRVTVSCVGGGTGVGGGGGGGRLGGRSFFLHREYNY